MDKNAKNLLTGVSLVLVAVVIFFAATAGSSKPSETTNMSTNASSSNVTSSSTTGAVSTTFKAGGTTTAVAKPETMTLTVFFRVDNPTDCGQTLAVKRTVPKVPAMADAALKVLFSECITDLKASYNKVTINNGKAVVDFKAAALPLLNGAACQQAAIKMPIQKTLMQFPTVKSVDYSIDGVIKTDWDA